MTEIAFWGVQVPLWIAMPLVYLVWVTILIFLKKLLFTSITRIVSRTRTRLDDLLVEAADFPLTLVIFTSGALVVERMIPAVEGAQITRNFLLIFKAISIIAVILFMDKFLNGLLQNYAGRVPILKTSGGVVRGFVRVIVIGLGVLVLLDSFGISITPIIASLGIGSLAVALALQPTLENLFAGIQIVIDRPFQVGQFVKLESGEEGYIHKVGWRSTWIRMLANNIVIMPNKVLVNSRITNYYYPETELAVLVQVGVHYESDLEQVEKVTIEVARETMQDVTGGIPEFDPFIRYHTFDDFSINFSVILRGREFVDNYLIKHEFIKRLHKRYAKEKIIIPYPIRAVNLQQEQTFGDNVLSVQNRV